MRIHSYEDFGDMGEAWGVTRLSASLSMPALKAENEFVYPALVKKGVLIKTVGRVGQLSYRVFVSFPNLFLWGQEPHDAPGLPLPLPVPTQHSFGGHLMEFQPVGLGIDS